MPSLIVSNLSYSYDQEKKIINNLSFSVDRPSAVHLIGDNGSGKTTTLILLSGFYVPQGGNITLSIDDKKVSSTDEKYFKHIYYVGSRLQEDEHLSLIEYIRFVSVMRAVDLEPEQILKDVRMESISRKKIVQLSAGMRRRFLIRLAIALNPALLLLDEPFSVMDKQWANWLIDRLREFVVNGGIVVMAHPNKIDITGVDNIVVQLS